MCRGWLCVDVEADDNFVVDEVVLHAWVFDIEVEAIDEEVGLEVDGISGLSDGDWSVDRLGDTVEVKVTSEQVRLAFGSSFGFDASDYEGAGRDSLHVEKVSRDKVTLEFGVVCECTGHIDGYFMTASGKGVAIDVEMA